MNIWHHLNSNRVTAERFIAVIEISKGSKKKYELDKETGMIILDRILHTSTHYPANYGFIPLTLSSDNDPLDVLVLCGEDLEPLCLVECYPIGLVRMIDESLIDDKIIAIPFNDPIWSHYHELKELPPHMADEIEHFFKVYKNLEHKETTGFEIFGRERAEATIKEAIQNYRENIL
ncbi:MAG: inorganic diphosphatase [Bacilli bacterium]|nr:inorganic diphosphatase [Bacilli bacterium]MDD4077056.1 inorganic diphosphatase [Bacilli bacterium]MDD4387851.1 inorganic diphosphatase [Bacilli bacterium]